MPIAESEVALLEDLSIALEFAHLPILPDFDSFESLDGTSAREFVGIRRSLPKQFTCYVLLGLAVSALIFLWVSGRAFSETEVKSTEVAAGSLRATTPFATTLTTTIAEARFLGNATSGNDSSLRCPEVPSVGLTEDWWCNSSWGFCEEVRASAVASHGAVQAMASPHGHVGDRSQLLSKLYDAWAARRLSVVVFGNSITKGQGCANAWPGRLKQQLDVSLAFLEGFEVELNVFAEGGTTTLWALANVGKYSKYLNRAHVLFVDLDMGDTPGSPNPSVYSIIAWTKAFVGTVRALESPPAIIYLETFSYQAYVSVIEWTLRPNTTDPWYNKFRECKKGPPEARAAIQLEMGQSADPCAMDVRCLPHWRALLQLEVPVFSYSDAVCEALPRGGPFILNGSIPYWRPGRGRAGPQHPSCDTHEVIAHLAAEFLSQEIGKICRNPMWSPPSKPPLIVTDSSMGAEAETNPWNVSFSCLLRFTSIYEASAEGPSLLVMAQQRQNSSYGSLSLEGPERFRGWVADASWVYAEDVKGKPGWISLPGMTGAIAFEVSTRIGDVIVEYLTTYVGTGTAFCQLGDGHELVLDARIVQKVSVSAFSRLHAEPSNGVYNLTCRSDGRKFKLLSIRAC